MMRMLGWGLLSAFIVAFLAVALMPGETTIDDGWKFTWIALMVGFAVGAAGSWFWSRRRFK